MQSTHVWGELFPALGGDGGASFMASLVPMFALVPGPETWVI